MRVAFVNQPFDELYGDQKNSIGLWSYRAAKELKNEHEVSIYCRNFGSEKPVTKDGITYHGFDLEVDNRRHAALRFLKLWFRKKRAFFATHWFYANYYQSIAKAIGKARYDVIHIHNFPQVVQMVRRENPDSAIVLHMHCDWLIQLYRPWIEKTLRNVNMVLGCSDHVINGIKKAFPHHAEKCHRLFNGFDSGRFYTSPKEKPPEGVEKPYLLYVGRGSPEKGIHLATRAFSQIAKDYPSLKLVCVGGIGDSPKAFLYDLVDEAVRRDMAPCFEKPWRDYVYEGISGEIKARILEIPHINYEDLVGTYQNAEMLVVPTVCHEAFGMPVLEAIACGTPIVASRCGGIPEFFMDGKDGFLFERGNLQSLVARISKILQAPVPLRSDEERQNSLSFFSWKKIVSELSSHYESLISRD